MHHMQHWRAHPYLQAQTKLGQFGVAGSSVAVQPGILWVASDGLCVALDGLWIPALLEKVIALFFLLSTLLWVNVVLALNLSKYFFRLRTQGAANCYLLSTHHHTPPHTHTLPPTPCQPTPTSPTTPVTPEGGWAHLLLLLDHFLVPMLCQRLVKPLDGIPPLLLPEVHVPLASQRPAHTDIHAHLKHIRTYVCTA